MCQSTNLCFWVCLPPVAAVRRFLAIQTVLAFQAWIAARLVRLRPPLDVVASVAVQTLAALARAVEQALVCAVELVQALPCNRAPAVLAHVRSLAPLPTICATPTERLVQIHAAASLAGKFVPAIHLEALRSGGIWVACITTANVGVVL